MEHQQDLPAGRAHREGRRPGADRLSPRCRARMHPARPVHASPLAPLRSVTLTTGRRRAARHPRLPESAWRPTRPSRRHRAHSTTQKRAMEGREGGVSHLKRADAAARASTKAGGRTRLLPPPPVGAHVNGPHRAERGGGCEGRPSPAGEEAWVQTPLPPARAPLLSPAPCTSQQGCSLPPQAFQQPWAGGRQPPPPRRGVSAPPQRYRRDGTAAWQRWAAAAEVVAAAARR